MTEELKEKLKDIASNTVFCDYNILIDELIDILDISDKDSEVISHIKDVVEHGCISGIVGPFIYNNDCRDFYIKYIDSLEDIKEELEEEYGVEIPNKKGLRHYTFMCWLIIEEFASLIDEALYDEHYSNN